MAVYVGSSWVELDYWTSPTGYGDYDARLRVLAYSTQNTANNTSNVYFKIQKRVTGGTAWNADPLDFTISGTGAKSDNHSASQSWTYGTVSSTSWTDVGGDTSDMYWSAVKHNDNGTLTMTARARGDRILGGSFDTNISIQLPTITRTYTVSYNANGGSGAPGNQTKTYGVNLTLSNTRPTRTGYTFSKWNTASNGSGTNYNPGGTYSGNAALTLYAQWTLNTYTIKINPNGGSFTSSKDSTSQTTEQTYTVNHGTSITSILGTRSGYECNGWFTAASGGTKIIPNNGNLSGIGQAYTLYAQWTKETPPPDPIYDIYAKIGDDWVPNILWIKVSDNWYRVLETELKVGSSWKRTKAT